MAKTKTATVRAPFKITTEPPYAEELRQAIAEIERGEYEEFEDTHAMFAKILAEDGEQA